MAEWAITHTTRFRAAVAQAGHSDMFSLAGTTGGYRMFGSPYERRAVYDAHSPITFVREARTPTLILHGERDAGVPVAQGYEFYHALKAQGVPTRMLVLPRQPHGPTEPRMQLAAMQANLDWFEKYLGGR